MAIAELGKTPRVATTPAASTGGADHHAAPVTAETHATGSAEHVAAVKNAVGQSQARILAAEAGMEQKLSKASNRQHCGKDFLGGGRRVSTEDTPLHSDMMRGGGGGGAKPPAPLPSPPQAPKLQPLKHGDRDVVANGHENVGKGLGELAGKIGEGAPDGRRPPISMPSPTPMQQRQHEGPSRDHHDGLSGGTAGEVAGNGVGKLLNTLVDKVEGKGDACPAVPGADVGVGVKKPPTSGTSQVPPPVHQHEGDNHAIEGAATLRMGMRLPGKNPLPKPAPPGAPRHQNAKGPVPQ